MLFDLFTHVQDFLEIPSNHLPLPVSIGEAVPTLMEEKQVRDELGRKEREEKVREEEEKRRLVREREEMELERMIRMDEQAKGLELRAAREKEEERKIAETEKGFRKMIVPGVLEDTVVVFDKEIRIGLEGNGSGYGIGHFNGNGNKSAHQTGFTKFQTYGPPLSEGLWTSYSVQAIPPISSTSTSTNHPPTPHHLPLAKILLIDFSTPYYTTSSSGHRKIQTFVDVVQEMIQVRHRNILGTLGVKHTTVEGMSGRWERVIVLVEKVGGVGGGEGPMSLRNWLSVCGKFEEDVAKVREDGVSRFRDGGRRDSRLKTCTLSSCRNT